jgi:Protein of unknown function (DUF3311)
MRPALIIRRHSNAPPHSSGGFGVKRPSFRAILLGLIPFVAMCFSVSAWDRIYPMVLGLPFNFFWLLSWIVLNSVCLLAAYRLETSRATKAAEHRDTENRRS